MNVRISEIINPGDKVDIKLAKQVDEEVETALRKEKVYKSQVLDLSENGDIEISMPVENMKIVLLPLAIRFEFVFYSKGNLYSAIGQVKERYKTDNIYALKIELKSTLEKFQRREFYRYDCAIDTIFFEITPKQSQMDNYEEILEALKEFDDLVLQEKHGVIVDLSGGGARVNTSFQLMPNTNILLQLELKNEVMYIQNYVVAHVISCNRVEKSKEEKYEVRVKFNIKADRVREEIIRFIFEEERRTRARK